MRDSHFSPACRLARASRWSRHSTLTTQTLFQHGHRTHQYFNMAIVPTNNGNIDAYSSRPGNLNLNLATHFAP